MLKALEREGCQIVHESSMPKLLGYVTVVRPLAPEEDPRVVRNHVTVAMRLVHPRCPRRFLGLFEE
jgi:hypothetical protein